MRSLLIVAAGLLVAALPAGAQTSGKPWADYFLVKQFGEVCTMCEVMVLCEAGEAPPTHGGVPAAGSFTLYNLHPFTFWDQMATIWPVFMANFRSGPPLPHTRPATIHTVTEGRWSAPVKGEAMLDLAPPGRIAFTDGTEINRELARWEATASDGGPARPLGYCERLPLWEALAAIEAAGDTAGGG